MPRMPSLLRVLAKLVYPAQISITSNSSTVIPVKKIALPLSCPTTSWKGKLQIRRFRFNSLCCTKWCSVHSFGDDSIRLLLVASFSQSSRLGPACSHAMPRTVAMSAYVGKSHAFCWGTRCVAQTSTFYIEISANVAVASQPQNALLQLLWAVLFSSGDRSPFVGRCCRAYFQRLNRFANIFRK